MKDFAENSHESQPATPDIIGDTLGLICNVEGLARNGVRFKGARMVSTLDGLEFSGEGQKILFSEEGEDRVVRNGIIAYDQETTHWRWTEFAVNQYGGTIRGRTENCASETITYERDMTYEDFGRLHKLMSGLMDLSDWQKPARQSTMKKIGSKIMSRFAVNKTE